MKGKGPEYGNGSNGRDFRVASSRTVAIGLSVSPEGSVTPPGRQVDPEALLAEIKSIAALGGRTGNKGQPRVYRK